MASFLQLHILTSYPPSNLNRDDMGSPKSAIVGGTNRIRISSQSLKRAWRTSDVFAHAVAASGIRTKELGSAIVFPKLLAAGVSEKDAITFGAEIAKVFGKNKSDKKDPKVSLNIEQIAFVSPEELAAIDALIARIGETKEAPSAKELELLRKTTSAADVALFGRMLASKPDFNIEAAAQVAHAFTVHNALAQDDFFTAVDDLTIGRDESGASHLGEREFAAGLYYLYICINADLLRSNLTVASNAEQATELAKKAMRGLTEAAATIAPNGMQNSFASRARASYILAEIGSEQPRSLSVAFLKAVKDTDMLGQSIIALTSIQTNMDTVYGNCAEKRYTLDTTKPIGTIKELLTFVEGA
jgi:CRISPR system Cascade subunit CasC